MPTELRNLLLLGSLVAVASCDRDGRNLLPPVPDGVPSVIEVGAVQVLTADELAEFQRSSDPWAFCAETDDEGRPRCLFPSVTNPPAGIKGGVTFTFEGTGAPVCIVADPETVYWSKAIAIEGRRDDYAYADFYADDGDVDLFAGLSSYYTGSPGVELGGFQGVYTDSLGRQIEIEYGECSQNGFLTGFDDAHAGRATVEFCTINTAERQGVEYTVVAETFSVPLDDGVLTFGAMVVEGRCTGNQGVNPDECTIRGESLDLDGNLKSCTDKLEEAYCLQDLARFCCANPEMCGTEPSDGLCGEYDRDDYCSETGLCCED